MLGGGTFIAQNKVLPGSYINFVSASSTNVNLGERGYAAIALPLKWGKDDGIFEVTSSDFRKNTVKLFGFTYDSDDAKGLRDLFKNIKTLYCYKLMVNGAKALNSMAEALYKGSAGLKIATEIVANTDNTFQANIYFNGTLVYEKKVAALTDLTSDDNGFVVWTLSTLQAYTIELMAAPTETIDEEEVPINLDGDPVTATEHSAFLDAAEAYTFNAMGCLSEESAIKDLYVQECKDMRDDHGVKYQLVVYEKAADFEGVVNVKNSVDAVWWTTGVIAGTAVNASCTNKKYDGEFSFNTNYTKAELENALATGQFVFHNVNGEVRVLSDINSLTTFSDTKGRDFQANQTIRVIDQIAMDIAKVFNTYYLGIVQNDTAGRLSFWNEVVKHHQTLESMRAIENFNPDDVVVERGDTKKDVVVYDAIEVVNAMEKLYMSVVVA